MVRFLRFFKVSSRVNVSSLKIKMEEDDPLAVWRELIGDSDDDTPFAGFTPMKKQRRKAKNRTPIRVK